MVTTTNPYGETAGQVKMELLAKEALHLHAEYLSNDSRVSSKLSASVMEACFEELSGEEAVALSEYLHDSAIQRNPTEYIRDASLEANGVREDEHNSAKVVEAEAYARITAAVYEVIGIPQPESGEDESWGGEVLTVE